MSSVNPGPDPAPDVAADLREHLGEVERMLGELLASRWLRVLERLEVPVRIVRPGLGTVWARLEAIRRLLHHVRTCVRE